MPAVNRVKAKCYCERSSVLIATPHHRLDFFSQRSEFAVAEAPMQMSRDACFKSSKGIACSSPVIFHMIRPWVSSKR